MYSVTPKQHLRLHSIEAELKKRIAYKNSEYSEPFNEYFARRR